MQENGDCDKIEQDNQDNKQDEMSAQPTCNLHSSMISIATIKDVTSIVQSIITVIAIIAAGIWFFMQREISPKFAISHSVTHRNLDENWTLIHLSVNITNIGKRRFAIKYGSVRVQRILPLEPAIAESLKRNESPPIKKDSFEVMWPMIGDPYEDEKIDIQMEYGESDTLYYEFLIPTFLRTVKVYSYFSTWKDAPYGWSQVTIYDLNTKGG